MSIEPDLQHDPLRRMPDTAVREPAVDQVVGHIRELIRARGLTVGDTLPSELELSQMFRSSRNTAREAMRVLRTYGIIESRPKIGAVITDRRSVAMMDAFSFAIDISADTFRDIQGFRRLIEINLADQLIARLSSSQLDKLAALNAKMEGAATAAAAAHFDYAFHAFLIFCAGNKTLAEVYGILQPVLTRLMETGKTKRRGLEGAFREHADVLDALRNHDRLAYTFYMTRHLNAGLEFIPDKEQAARGR